MMKLNDVHAILHHMMDHLERNEKVLLCPTTYHFVASFTKISIYYATTFVRNYCLSLHIIYG